MDSSTATGESGSAPPLGGGTLQTEPDPFAELDPGIFVSGESTTERNNAETQTQTGEETDFSSSESDVEMRDSENTVGKQSGSGTAPDPDPNVVQPGSLKTSDLSAAEIKKLYRETIEKKRSTSEKNNEKQSVYQKTFPAEADAVPSESYKKIHASKMLKGKQAASGGTGSGQVLDSECGSFFNPGDNRISRTVYQEDHLSLSVTSLSFNPSNWECRQCPKKHKVVEQGGGGGNCPVPVIVKNFPGVLPTVSGKCLSIIRLEQGKLDELGDLLIRILPKGVLPRGTTVLVGSLSHLQKENVSGYATACVKIVKRFDGYFKKEIRTVPFVPPPMGGCDNPRMGKDILDLCNWLENMDDYPLKSAMGLLSKTGDIVGGGGGGFR
jgi:hypothetical protein